MPIRHGICGIADGNFRKYPADHPLGKDENAPMDATDQALRKKGNFISILRIECAMRTCIADGDDPRLWEKTGDKRLTYVLKYSADGVITRKPNVALAIANADSPVAVMWDNSPGRRFIALLNCAVRSLVPENGGQGIIRRFAEQHGITETMYAMAAYGAGICCSKPQFDACIYAIFRAQCRMLGFKDAQIISRDENLPCTACKRDHESRLMFHSDARDGADDAGANLAFAFIDQ